MNNELQNLTEQMEQINILIRTNNLLLSRFILELSRTRKELGLPKRNIFFKFELLESEYFSLVDEFGKEKVDKVLYRLDRMLLTNKQECPNNISKYVRKKLRKANEKLK